MVVIKPYLDVNNALEAMELYKKIFNADVVRHVPVEKHQATGLNIPEGTDLSKTTMHSELKIGDSIFYMCDNFWRRLMFQC